MTVDFHSRHLGPRQRRGLLKLGDVWCPGDGEFPSFSDLGCAEHVDAVLDEMHPADFAQLKLLLAAMAALPARAIARIIELSERGDELSPTNPVGGQLRFVRLGVRGLVLGLYWSGRTGEHHDGKSPLELIGYQVGVYTGDLE